MGHQIYTLNNGNYKVKLFAIRKYLWSLIIIQHHSLRVRHPSIPKCTLQNRIWLTIVLDLRKWKEWISWWRWNLKKCENLCLCFYPTWFRPSGRWAKPKMFLQLFPISWEGLVWMRKWLSHCMLLSWQARVSDWIYTSQLPECQGTPCSKETRYLKFKGALSSLRPFLAAENPLRMIKNAFYFTSKALFVLKISKFLSWLFGHVTKRFNKKNNVNFTFYDVRAWLTNNCNIHIAQHLEK